MIKSIILSIVFFAAIGVHGGVRAQIIPYDSLTVNTLLGYHLLSSDPTNIEGSADEKQVEFHNPSTEYIFVQFAAGTQPVMFQRGAQIHVFWLRQSADSCGADIQFMYQDPNIGFPTTGPTVKLVESGPLNVENESTIIVPDTGYNALSITVATDTGANTCYLDAISLIQSGVAGVAAAQGAGAPALTSYPNPFPRADGTTVRVSSTAQGIGLLRIYDVLGSEVMQAPLGELTEGERDVKIAIDRPGIFFARLFVNGSPIGGPLRIASE